MVSPTLWVEGVHVPRVGDETGMGLVQGGEYQLRGAMSWSPIDLTRGVMLIDQAATECRQIEAGARARRVLELGDAIGELAARRAEREVLLDARERVDALVAHTEARVRAGVGTHAQLTTVQSEALRLSRRAAQLDAEIARLVEAGHDTIDATHLADDVTTYEASAISLEEQRSSMRRLAPWTVSLRGGVVPGERVDWFGQIQLGMNLGLIANQVAEDSIVAARRDELAEDADELRAHVARFEQRVVASLPGLRDELTHVQTLIQLQRDQHELLGRIESSEVEHTRTLIELTLVGLEAERTHLEALIAAREGMTHASPALETDSHADE